MHALPSRKRTMNRIVFACLALALFTAPLPSATAADATPSSANPQETPHVTTPPDSIFEKIRNRDRDVARAFYKKYLDIGGGLCCMASGEVADEALQRTHYIV